MQWIAWLAYLAGCLLILESSIAEYRPGGFGSFFWEKGEIAESALWRWMLYVHVIAGLICVFSALPQFSKALIRRVPSMHRIAGRIYGFSVIFLLAPTGFYLGLYAKGGMPGKLGFLTLAMASFYTTLAGWMAIMPRTRDMASHRRWMIRSFALAATAISFRLYYIIGFAAGVSVDTNYIGSLWLSIIGNLAVAELIIRYRRISQAFPIQLQTES